jgi:hypothetical protein
MTKRGEAEDNLSRQLHVGTSVAHEGIGPGANVQDEVAPHTRGVTRRVVLSLLLAVIFGYIIPIIAVNLSNTFLGAAHLPPGAIAALLLLLLVVNPLLGVVSRRLRLSRNEVLTVYITCMFSTLVPGHGGENFFVGTLIGPFYYATRENGWLEFLRPMSSRGSRRRWLITDAMEKPVALWLKAGTLAAWMCRRAPG